MPSLLVASQQSHAEIPTLTPAIVTVHGTNDADGTGEGGRWWQRGSTFTSRLTEELHRRGVASVEIIPHRWSGANSDHDRLEGASRLARTIAGFEKAGRPYTLVAHSHGGNVTMEALATAPAARSLNGVVTFGTPFFTRRLKAVPLTIALFKTLLGLVIAPIMVWYLAEILPSDSTKKIEAIIVFGALLMLAILSFVGGLRALSRAPKASRRLAQSVRPHRWLVIHSPRDEAMRLLETAATIAPEYVTVPAAIRSITTFGTVAGVAGTIAFFAYSWRYFLDPIRTKIGNGQFDLGAAADFTFLLVLPIVYGAIYGLFWAFARFGGGWLYAKLLSRTIHGGVLGAAYGGDGKFKLTSVKRSPPYPIEASEDRIEALNLGGIDEKAIFVSAQRLYDGIIADEETNTGLGDPDKLWKHLSDALYHNAYMRDDAVIARVADHIAVMARPST